MRRWSISRPWPRRTRCGGRGFHGRSSLTGTCTCDGEAAGLGQGAAGSSPSGRLPPPQGLLVRRGRRVAAGVRRWLAGPPVTSPPPLPLQCLPAARQRHRGDLRGVARCHVHLHAHAGPLAVHRRAPLTVPATTPPLACPCLPHCASRPLSGSLCPRYASERPNLTLPLFSSPKPTHHRPPPPQAKQPTLAQARAPARQSTCRCQAGPATPLRGWRGKALCSRRRAGSGPTWCLSAQVTARRALQRRPAGQTAGCRAGDHLRLLGSFGRSLASGILRAEHLAPPYACPSVAGPLGLGSYLGRHMGPKPPCALPIPPKRL
jgi:hypothetical protein